MLYEVITQLLDASPVAEAAERVLALVRQLNDDGIVITSYSIHYTKLYEQVNTFRRLPGELIQ